MNTIKTLIAVAALLSGTSLLATVQHFENRALTKVSVKLSPYGIEGKSIFFDVDPNSTHTEDLEEDKTYEFEATPYNKKGQPSESQKVYKKFVVSKEFGFPVRFWHDRTLGTYLFFATRDPQDERILRGEKHII